MIIQFRNSTSCSYIKHQHWTILGFARKRNGASRQSLSIWGEGYTGTAFGQPKLSQSGPSVGVPELDASLPLACVSRRRKKPAVLCHGECHQIETLLGENQLLRLTTVGSIPESNSPVARSGYHRLPARREDNRPRRSAVTGRLPFPRLVLAQMVHLKFAGGRTGNRAFCAAVRYRQNVARPPLDSWSQWDRTL